MTDNQKPMKKVSPRRRARECAVQALYSWAISGNAPEQVELFHSSFPSNCSQCGYRGFHNEPLFGS